MKAITSAVPLPNVVIQHVEEAAHLGHVRNSLVAAPHVRLEALRRHDMRLAAHLDGVAVAGEFGWEVCEAALDADAPGAAFCAGARAVEEGRPDRIDKVLSLAQALPAARQGLRAAFGWVSAQSLQGLIRSMLGSTSAVHRELGIVACTTHRVDPGAMLVPALADPEDGLRLAALRAAGERGRLELGSTCAEASALVAAPEFRFAAARSAALLGERRQSMDALSALSMAPGPQRDAAVVLLVKLLAPADCGTLLKRLFDDPGSLRTMVRGMGAAGDPRFVPWLVERIGEPALARLAGESFAMITGCDLASSEFFLQPAEGPAAEPEAEDDADAVALDEDEGLPVADPAKVAAWWRSNGHRFAVGTRYFIGATPSAQHCQAVLRGGTQRQRIAAAEHLALLVPGTPLFNTAAPAWRQERWLNAVGT